MSNLEQKTGIKRLMPYKDKSSKYFSFCNFDKHPGIIYDTKIVDECLMKGCRHYRVYREFLR